MPSGIAVLCFDMSSEQIVAIDRREVNEYIVDGGKRWNIIHVYKPLYDYELSFWKFMEMK